ncbi:MAG: hypothetical protein SFU53_06770, partial [Terrimicrobiaceae bacterium]|nr:hypothetical protein [Terrimicrobiaceae bacterium]
DGGGFSGLAIAGWVAGDDADFDGLAGWESGEGGVAVFGVGGVGPIGSGEFGLDFVAGGAAGVVPVGEDGPGRGAGNWGSVCIFIHS